MKKYIILFFTALAFTFVNTACDDDTDPGGTAVQKMAGDWWVTFKNVGNSDYEGEYGPYLMYTYNTAANTDAEMWLEDGGHFWDYKLKVNVSYANRTFQTSDFAENIAYESKVKITEGKITEGAATTPSGMPADKIEYKIQFDDDGYDGSVVFEVTGFRRSGFPADDF